MEDIWKDILDEDEAKALRPWRGWQVVLWVLMIIGVVGFIVDYLLR